MKHTNCNGYNLIYFPSHHLASTNGSVYEHILVAEQLLGRELKPGEVVHHKDEVRNHNSKDNLMVFKTKSDHTAFHNGAPIVLEDDVWVAQKGLSSICPLCGNKKDRGAKTCLNCHKKQQLSSLPSFEELKKCLQSDKTMEEIATYYHVSSNAVRKWCKKYNLPYQRSLRRTIA